MPPRFKFTREQIIDYATILVQRDGEAALTARGLADVLGTSSKPIFGLFSGMDEVKKAVISNGKRIYSEKYVKEEMAKNPALPYKCYGMAYVRMALEDKNLFKMIYFRERTEEEQQEEDREIDFLIDIIAKVTGISKDKARLFHLDMWLYIHGIATTCVTQFAKWDMDTISNLITAHFLRLKNQYLGG